jgi:hypothetical protein
MARRSGLVHADAANLLVYGADHAIGTTRAEVREHPLQKLEKEPSRPLLWLRCTLYHGPTHLADVSRGFRPSVSR